MTRVAGLDTRQLGELKAWLEPFFGSSRGNRGHGSGSAAATTLQVPVYLDTPDLNGEGYPAFTFNNGFSNVRRVVPGFSFGAGHDSTWEGALVVPHDYVSGGKLVLRGVCNATSGVVRLRVSTKVVAAGASLDGAYTDESYVNTTVPGTVLLRHDITFTLTTTPAGGSTLNVKVTRNNTNAADTLAVDWLLWSCVFEYVT